MPASTADNSFAIDAASSKTPPIVVEGGGIVDEDDVVVESTATVSADLAVVDTAVGDARSPLSEHATSSVATSPPHITPRNDTP